MTRSVFYGFGAYVGSITGPTSCGWWPDDPATLNWAPAAQIAIDLGKTPQAARSGKIKIPEIQADDYHGYTFGGLTRIGPMWPGGVMTGLLWVESEYWRQLAPKGTQPPRIPPGAQSHAYESTTVLYWDGPLKDRRFQGLHVQILSSQGDNALVTLWQPGTSKIPAQNPLGTWWIDLKQNAHPIEPDLTEVGVAATDRKEGALFLDLTMKKVIPFSCPKNPKWTGGAIAPKRGHHVDR